MNMLDWLQADQPATITNPPINPEHTTAPNGTSVDVNLEKKKKITRTRTSYSCHECRKRKVKCDKVHPVCGNCIKSGEACTYDIPTQATAQASNKEAEDSKHGTKRRRDLPTPSTDGSVGSPTNFLGDSAEAINPSVESRIQRLTAIVESLRRDRGYNGSEHGQEKPSEQHPNSGPKNTTSNHSTLPRRSDYDDLSNAVEDAMVQGYIHSNSEWNDLKLSYLSLEDKEKSQLTGATFFTYVAEELGQVNLLLKKHNKYVSATSTLNSHCGEVQVGQESEDELDSNEDHNGFHKYMSASYPTKAKPLKDCPACRAGTSDKMSFFQNKKNRYSHHHDSAHDQPHQHLSRREGNILFRCWLSGVHGLIPLAYPPIALEKHERFWDWHEHQHETGLPMPDPEFMPMLWAIWYAGCTCAPPAAFQNELSKHPRAPYAAWLHDQTVKSLNAVNFPHQASIPALSAYLMINTILVKEEEPITTGNYISLAIRVAQTMGLHRDPSIFVSLETWEAELRRRLWWHILWLDMMVAIASGLPPMISDDHYWDVKPISELKDYHLRSPEGALYTKLVLDGDQNPHDPDDPAFRTTQSMVDVHYVVARAKFRFCVQLRKILRVHLGATSISREGMDTVRKVMVSIECEIKDTISRIPTKGIPELGFIPQNGGGFDTGVELEEALASNPTMADLSPFLGGPNEMPSTPTARYHWKTLSSFHRYSRIMLSMLTDRAYTLTYATFLKQLNSRLWLTRRQCALHHAHGFLRKFICLASASEFQPFLWSWSSSHQPMHAAIVLLIDLHERPHSVEAPSSRAFIDKILSLSEPSQDIVGSVNATSVQFPFREGGSPPWHMLRSLRANAWRKVGLDPKIHWTHQKQIEAGVAKPLDAKESALQAIREDSMLVPSYDGLDIKTTTAQAMNEVVSLSLKETEAAKEDQGVSSNLKKRRFAGPNRVIDRTSNHGLAKSKSTSTDASTSNAATLPSPHTSSEGNVSSIISSNNSDSSDAGYGTEINSAHSFDGTDNTSFLNANHGDLNRTDDMEMDAVFDWGAWDAVFGHQPAIDDMFYAETYQEEASFE